MRMIARVLMMSCFALVYGQSMGQKKVQSFKMSKELPVSAMAVWKVVGEDYGKIAHSHPKIVASDYLEGSLAGGEGVERVCYFNEKETRFLKEKMINYSPENMSFTNTVFQAGKFPVDPELTRAIYSVEDTGNGRSRITFDMQYRTKPGFMGAMMKGNFKRLIRDYFIAIEHHVKTGEVVTKENFKKIKKQYTDSTLLLSMSKSHIHGHSLSQVGITRTSN